MGVPPTDQGRLYWFQESALIRQHREEQMFAAKLAGAKING